MARKSGRAALALALEQRKTLEELAASRSAPAREVESDDVDQLGSDEVRRWLLTTVTGTARRHATL